MLSKLKNLLVGLALVLLVHLLLSDLGEKMPPDTPLSRGERLILLTTLLLITMNLYLLAR
jgi:hypothetical protein